VTPSGCSDCTRPFALLEQIFVLILWEALQS
jgi:hypothetical protein